MIISGRGRSSAATSLFFSRMTASSPGVESEKSRVSVPTAATALVGVDAVAGVGVAAVGAAAAGVAAAEGVAAGVALAEAAGVAEEAGVVELVEPEETAVAV